MPLVDDALDPLPDPPTIPARLARIAARLRERALVAGTFNAELADDLEALAAIAAQIRTIQTRVDDLVDRLETEIAGHV